MGRGYPDFTKPTREVYYIEGRRLLFNDAITPTTFENTLYRGKFFPHGARGFIHRIYAYLKNTAPAKRSLQLQVSPYPRANRIFQVTIEIDAKSEGWVSASADRWWDYDSIFLIVNTWDPYLMYGYDELTPYDGFSGQSVDGPFTIVTRRPYFRVDMAGQTPGDLPVSGTVNAVLLPSSTVGATSGSVTIPPGTLKTIMEIEEPGRSAILVLRTNEKGVYFRIYVDGVLLRWGHDADVTPEDMNKWGTVGGGYGWNLMKYDVTNNFFTMVLTFPIEWRTKLRIDAYNPAAESKWASMGINYLKLA